MLTGVRSIEYRLGWHYFILLFYYLCAGLLLSACLCLRVSSFFPGYLRFMVYLCVVCFYIGLYGQNCLK